MRIQLIHSRKALFVLPEEMDKFQLREYANDIRTAFFRDQDSVDSTAKNLHCFCQVCRAWKRDEWLLLVAHFLDISQRYRLSFSSLLGKLVKRCYVFFVGVREADDEEEVCVEVAVIKCPGCDSCVFAVAQEDDIGRAVTD